MRIVVDLSTEYLKDRFCIPVQDSDGKMAQLMEEIHRRYKQWHSFKVYEFQIFRTPPVESSKNALDSEVISEFFKMPDECSRERKVHCYVVESEHSVARRKEDERREEAKRIAREKEKRKKERERKKQIKQLKLNGESWELENISPYLKVSLDLEGQEVENAGNLDQWCTIRYVRPIKSKGKYFYSVRIVADPSTTNTWRICVGVVPQNFKWDAERHWVGSQKSWAYVAGTGGKVHDSGKSTSYGAKYGLGDVIGVLLNFDQCTIEFFKNGTSQGVAFTNLVGAQFYPAVSVTGKGAKIQLVKDIPQHLHDTIEAERQREARRRQHLKKITSLEFEQSQLDLFVEQKLNTWQASFSFRKDEAIYYPQSADGSDGLLVLAQNEGSSDKWRCARTVGAYVEGKKYFEMEILDDCNSTNTWRISIGVVPISFDSEADRVWVGSQHSWAYIAGSGGKCYNSGQMTSYAEPYSTGDVIGVFLDFDSGAIEYFKNGIPQGVAFTNLIGPVHGAVSMTGEGSQVRFVNRSIECVSRYRQESASILRTLEEIKSNYGNVWNEERTSRDICIKPDKVTLEYTTKANKWRVAIGEISYASGRRYVEFHIKELPHTTNTWKIVFGVVGKGFKHDSSKIWVGAQGSWGYIGGTGGKAYNSGKSISYGSKFGKGDRIGILLDFDNRTIHFYKNGVCQGEAFTDLTGPVYPAVSMTSKGTVIQLDALEERNVMEKYVLYH